MNAFPRDVSHHESAVSELKKDRELAVEYFRQAVQALRNRDESAGALAALSILEQAFGSLKTLATEVGTAVPIFETAAEYQDWVRYYKPLDSSAVR